MSDQNTLKYVDDYATEDALFAKTMHHLVDQPIPNVWRKTVKQSVLSRIKHALLGYKNISHKHSIRVNRHASTDSVTTARRFTQYPKR